MSGYALLLDSGATWELPHARTREDARAALAAHNARHREEMADRVRYRYDYERFPVIVPRLAVGLVCPKPKDRGASRIGSLGGKARAAKLTPERRHQIAQKAARARWSAEAKGTA